MRARRGLFLLAAPVIGLVAALTATTPEPATGALEDETRIADESFIEATPPPELAVPPRPIRVADELLEKRIIRRRRLFADFVRVYARTVREKEQARVDRFRAHAKEADLAFRRGEFDAARRYAEAAVLEDPDSEAAQRLVRIATAAGAEAARHATAAGACVEGWDEASRRLNDLTRPPADTAEDTVLFGVNTATQTERDPDDADAEATVVERLDAVRVRGFSCDGQDLDQIMTRLCSLTGLSFHLTPAARRTRFDDVRITVPGLDEVSIRWILTNVVTTPYELGWEIRDGVVTIATKDEVRPQLRLKYFDVKDLSVKIQNFKGDNIFLSPSSYIPPDPPELVEPEPVFPPDPLVEAIRSAVDPGTWDLHGASIDLKNGTLIVKHTPAAIESVRLFLELLRETIHEALGRPDIEFHSIAPRGEDEAATPASSAATPGR
jgi:hypothetical protein